MYTNINTAKTFLPSHHACKRTPHTSRLVPLPAHTFHPRTAVGAVGEGKTIGLNMYSGSTDKNILKKSAESYFN